MNFPWFGIHKLLRALRSGKAPKGNFGAYVCTTRKRVLFDYFRKLRRTRVRFAEASDAVEWAIATDSFAEYSMLDWFIKELPPIQRDIIRRRLLGQKWAEIVESLGITAKEARQMMQGIEWPGGLSERRVGQRNGRAYCRATSVGTSMPA
jgi:DNA-directed RNA polymerase specialized sigma24 family protein